MSVIVTVRQAPTSQTVRIAFNQATAANSLTFADTFMVNGTQINSVVLLTQVDAQTVDLQSAQLAADSTGLAWTNTLELIAGITPGGGTVLPLIDPVLVLGTFASTAKTAAAITLHYSGTGGAAGAVDILIQRSLHRANSFSTIPGGDVTMGTPADVLDITDAGLAPNTGYDYVLQVTDGISTLRTEVLVIYTQPSGDEDNGAYLTVNDAQDLAQSVPDMAAFLAKDKATQAGLLLAASIDIDAGKYQGRRYDPRPYSVSLSQGQRREFPRIPHAEPLGGSYPIAGGGVVLDLGSLGASVGAGIRGGYIDIWDWDPDANGGQGAAVVPVYVKQACLFQAAWLCKPQYQSRIEAIRSGLAARSIGTASETFFKNAGGDSLCDRASRIMSQYLLSGGRMV